MAKEVIEDIVIHYKQTMQMQNKVMERNSEQIQVCWLAPMTPFVKLNVDCVHGNDKSGCGGILRNANGSLLGGFAKSIGKCIVLMAEIWGIYIGIKMTVDLGSRR